MLPDGNATPDISRNLVGWHTLGERAGFLHLVPAQVLAEAMHAEAERFVDSRRVRKTAVAEVALRPVPGKRGRAHQMDLSHQAARQHRITEQEVNLGPAKGERHTEQAFEHGRGRVAAGAGGDEYLGTGARRFARVIPKATAIREEPAPIRSERRPLPPQIPPIRPLRGDGLLEPAFHRGSPTPDGSVSRLKIQLCVIPPRCWWSSARRNPDVSRRSFTP